LGLLYIRIPTPHPLVRQIKSSILVMYEQKFKDKSKKVKIIYEIKQKHTKLSVSGENI